MKHLSNKQRLFTRRSFLEAAAALSAGLLFNQKPGSGQERLVTETVLKSAATRPSIYLTRDKIMGLRSLAEIKAATASGHAHKLWQAMMASARNELEQPPLTPISVFPGRSPVAVQHNNPDYVICQATGQRLLRGALAHLLTEEIAYKESVLAQLAALFDEQRWPAWIDQAHLRFGMPADLRTGMLGRDVALTYDWLHASLSDSERNFVLEGLDKRGIQPYLDSIKHNPWWTRDLNNWLTVIVGGFGIAGMALQDDHPQARHLIDYSKPLMEKYLSTYGPEGEFNESVAYANATRLPAAYYLAEYYASKGGENRLARSPFPETCVWTMYFTLPPGRVAAFGDAHVEAPVEVQHVVAVAAATRHPILQWFYLQHVREQDNPLYMLWYDLSVEAKPPDGKMPLGRAFHAQGAGISSRTSWDPHTTACVVYGKAGREENHEHNDIGQLCIDGYGERLIVDLGSPSSYPPDFFDEGRWHYYNASVHGHNVLRFGGREMRTLELERGERAGADLSKISGMIVSAAFDDGSGGHWLLDLTAAYSQVKFVKRAVVHLFPGFVAVLDEAALETVEAISLRWHTSDRSAPDEQGNFLVTGSRAKLAGRIINLGGQEMTLQRNEHVYEPPYDRDRLGQPLEPRRENYVEAVMQSDHCRLLTLFAVSAASEPSIQWKDGDGFWKLMSPLGEIRVAVAENSLSVQNVATGARQRVLLD